MLVLKQYGVSLIRVQEKDIELIRYWRNQSDIVNFMEYKNYIFPDAQKKWFTSIDNKLNYYFIIEFENKKIGLINVKNYDRLAGFGEGGIFIWDKNYVGSFAAVFSSLCLLNFMLLKVNVCSKSRVRILSNNDRAIHYNKLLGYKLISGQERELNQLYELDVNDYLQYNRGSGQKIIRRLRNKNKHINIFISIFLQNNLSSSIAQINTRYIF